MNHCKIQTVQNESIVIQKKAGVQLDDLRQELLTLWCAVIHDPHPTFWDFDRLCQYIYVVFIFENWMQCWLILIGVDADWCWLVLIDADWCWLMLIDADWCWLMLIDADWCWLILIGVDAQIRFNQVLLYRSFKPLESLIFIWIVAMTSWLAPRLQKETEMQKRAGILGILLSFGNQTSMPRLA